MKVRTFSLGAGKDTVVFAATAAANGEDTITGFTAGASNDVLDVKAFLGTTSAKVGGAGSGLGSAGEGVSIASAGFDATSSGTSGNVIYVNDKTSLTSANFGSSASANKIGVAASTKYVVIAKGESADTIYYVDVDSNTSATVTSVGTVAGTLDAFVVANFA